MCNKSNYEFFYKYFGDTVDYIISIPIPTSKFDIDFYNNLLKSEEFWGHFQKYDRILFVQDDGMIVKPGMETEFLQYDYVGAPWKKEWSHQDPNLHLITNINPELVGNGGVSLRNPKAMLAILKKYNKESKRLHYDKVQQEPEDVFFSR